MRAVQIPGHNDASLYPSTSLNAEYLPDGSVRGLPPSQVLVSLTGQGRGFTFWRGACYIVQGTTLYRWDGSGSSVAIATGLPSVGAVSFAPLSESLVCVVGGEIWLVDRSGSARKVGSRPSGPPAPSWSLVYWTVEIGTFESGTLSYQAVTGGYWLQDQTNDPEYGAHAYIRPSASLGSTPRYVSGYAVRIDSVQQMSSRPFVEPIQVHLVREVQTSKELIEGTELLIGHPYRVGEHRARFLSSVRIDGSLGLRIWLNAGWRVTFSSVVRFYNAITPRYYAVTRVVNGIESLPTYVEVSTEESNYWVSFSGLPAGTWRLYRKDSAGVYRLVHEGSGSAYVDYKSDEELGEELVLDSAPSSAQLCVGWNRRAVLAEGSRLYITDAGRYGITDDGEVIDVEDEVIALAVARGQLYYGTREGWYVLYGWGESLTTARVSSEPAVVGFVGDMLGGQEGAFLPGAVKDMSVRARVMRTQMTDVGVYWLTDTGELYRRYADGRWTKVAGEWRAFRYYGGVLYLQDDSGLHRLQGVPGSFRVKFTLPFESPMQLYQLVLVGSGPCVLKVLERGGSWRVVPGSLPLALDRVGHDYFSLSVEVEASALSRLLLELEPRLQKERVR